MSNRVRRVHVEKMFQYFCDCMGLPHAKYYGEAGTYILSYAPEYGGYTIQQFDAETTGHNLPFGMSRYSGKELIDMMRFAIYAVSLHKKEDN